MLNIQINMTVGSAKLVTATPIKGGGSWPVKLVFDSNPGELTTAALALSRQSSTPEVLAYLDEWEKQNATTYTGMLNTNDTRLLAALAGKSSQAMDCELRLSFDGGAVRVFPNFAVTVQPPVVTGPEASEGGPVWLDQAQGDARYVRPSEPVPQITLAAPDGSTWELAITNDGQIERTKIS